MCVRDRLGAKLSYQHAVNTSSFDHRDSGGNDNLRLSPALWKYLAIKQCFARRVGGKRDSKVGLPSTLSMQMEAMWHTFNSGAGIQELQSNLAHTH